MIEENVSLLLSIVSLVAVIWRAATESEQIRGSIKDVRDELNYKYDVELEKIRAKLQELAYQNHGNKEVLEHRTKRFEAEINNIKAYLQKNFDFQIRRYRPLDDDDGPRSGPL